MVASIDEQRSGLNDTLSLLDSMLANAPIGLAFFDRHCRFVRVNQVFAEMTGVPLSRHLGRTLPELLPQPVVAQELEDAVLRVFASGKSVRNLELNGQGGKPKRAWTWLVNAYPVRTTPQQVRWVGVIVLDASDRKRSEEALRRSEKLAATGRLAASICARDQQSAGGDYEPALSAAELFSAGGAGVGLCHDGAARSAANFGDYPADAPLLPAIDAARAGQHGRLA